MLRRQLTSLAKRSASFKASDLIINKNPNPAALPDGFHTNEFLADLPFGTLPTPHILHIDWCAQAGWSAPKIEPFSNLSIPAGAAAIHYGVQCFEGMKAYYQEPKDRVVMFRPDMNAKRMQRSSSKISLPTDFDTNELVKCIRELVSLDKEWVPKNENGSLYIRPTHIATNSNLGVSATDKSKLFVMCTPVGPYFKTGFNAVSLLADAKYVRAWPGGTGDVKCGGNYGPTIDLQRQCAEESGCAQVLWLFKDNADLSPLITEVGTMNFMMMWHRPSDGKLELLTPPLDDPIGSNNMNVILPGVTRDSLLALARSWGEFEVSERSLRWDEFVTACNDGRVIEVFGAGTACVVCPVGSFLDRTTNPGQDHWLNVPAEEQVYRKKFYNALTGIQLQGDTPPDANWLIEC